MDWENVTVHICPSMQRLVPVCLCVCVCSTSMILQYYAIMEIELELFASPFLSFHSSGSSGVICYSVASNKLLGEHHSWDDYLDRSYSIEWLQCIFIPLKFPPTVFGSLSLFYKQLMTSRMFLL